VQWIHSYGDNAVPFFRDNLVVSSSKFNPWTWNRYVVSKRWKQLYGNTASHPRRTDTSTTPMPKPETPKTVQITSWWKRAASLFQRKGSNIIEWATKYPVCGNIGYIKTNEIFYDFYLKAGYCRTFRETNKILWMSSFGPRTITDDLSLNSTILPHSRRLKSNYTTQYFDMIVKSSERTLGIPCWILGSFPGAFNISVTYRNSSYTMISY
jgi:hypothetical protein